MKKIKIYTYISLIIIVFILFILPSIKCFLARAFLNSGPELTYDIDEAKSIGVFLAEYKAIPNQFSLPDGTIIKFEEIWTEKFWVYTGKCKNILKIYSGDTCYINIAVNNSGINKMFKYFPGIIGFEIDGKQEMGGGAFAGGELIRNETKLLNDSEVLKLTIEKDSSDHIITQVYKTFILKKI